MRANPVITLLNDLIRRRSVTPDDAGCQYVLMERLAAIGFECEKMPFGDVSNFWARRGTSEPVLCFAGHTDVVPPGALEEWTNDPFEPIARDDAVFGRGAPYISEEEVFSVAAVCLAIDQSIRDRGPVRVHFSDIGT